MYKVFLTGPPDFQYLNEKVAKPTRRCFTLKGLASHCHAKTTFTFHFITFMLKKAFDNVKIEK